MYASARGYFSYENLVYLLQPLPMISTMVFS